MIVKAPVPLRCARCIPPPELAPEGGNPGSIEYWGGITVGCCPEGELKRDGQHQREKKNSRLAGVPSPYPDVYVLGIPRCMVVVVVVLKSEW